MAEGEAHLHNVRYAPTRRAYRQPESGDVQGGRGSLLAQCGTFTAVSYPYCMDQNLVLNREWYWYSGMKVVWEPT